MVLFVFLFVAFGVLELSGGVSVNVVSIGTQGPLRSLIDDTDITTTSDLTIVSSKASKHLRNEGPHQSEIEVTNIYKAN